MTPEQWSRLESLFDRGLDADPAAREDLLRECADDPAVQAELRNLWREEDSGAPGVLDHPPEFAQLLKPMPILAPNDVLAGRFTVLDLIGSGGMGEVYRARDERLQRIVAVKVLSSRLAADETYRRRLEQEARLVSSLSHPAICALHDLCFDGDLLFLVMEHVPGEALDVRLRRGPMEREEALRIALEICAGLQHAHAAGLVHRDLKPANVILSPHGVKLLDFGVACRAGAVAATPPSVEDGTAAAGPVPSGLTAQGQIIGTPRYMSPEQAAGKPVDARSDIYSFGLLLREMLTPQGLSGRLLNVVARCLETGPERRYPDVAELSADLRQATGQQPRPRARRWTAGVAALTGVTGLVLWYSLAANSQTVDPRLSILTSYPGTEYHPTLSPDGSKVAFLWNGDPDNYDIYVRPLDSDSPVRLTTDPASERSPSWSPDGKWIAFARNSKLMLIPAAGGPERTLTAIRHDIPLSCSARLSWTADSKRLVFSQESSPDAAVALQDIDIDSGKVRTLTRPLEGGGGHWCPLASPNGRLVLYNSLDERTAKYRLASLDDAGLVASERELSWIDGWSHAWTPDSRELLFTRNIPGAALLFRSAIASPNEPRKLPFGEEGMYPVMSATTPRLIYMRRQLDISIWSVGIAKQAARPPQKILASSQPDRLPVYSPDGNRIAFHSDRGGKSEIWIARADGSAAWRVAASDASKAPPGWSPDGEYLVYSDQGDLYRIETRNNQPGAPELLLGGPAQDTSPSYSRDGKWLYFTSDRSGHPAIWRMPAIGGPAVQITAQRDSYYGLESADGRQLFFLRNEKGKDRLYVMPATGGLAQRIAEVPARISMAVTERGLYFIAAAASPDESPVLSFYESSTGVIKPVATVPRKQRNLAAGLSIARDGESALMAFYELQGDLVLVDNFR